MHIKYLIIRGLKDYVLLFSKHVHKNISIRQTYMKHLVLHYNTFKKHCILTIFTLVKARLESNHW